jgi:hypothetical protein
LFQDIPNDENYSCFGVDQSLGRSADSSFASAKGVKKNCGEQKKILTDKRTRHSLNGPKKILPSKKENNLST